MNKIIIVNGNARVGKTTLVKSIDNSTINICYQLSTIDFFKAVSEDFGWDGLSKTDKDRELWHNLKMSAIKYDPMFSVKRMDSLIEETSCNDGLERFWFIDCREPTEIQKFKNFYGGNCLTLLVINNKVTHIPNNNADKNVREYNYDITVDNSGSIQCLKSKIDNIINQILLHGKEE